MMGTCALTVSFEVFELPVTNPPGYGRKKKKLLRLTAEHSRIAKNKLDTITIAQISNFNARLSMPQDNGFFRYHLIGRSMKDCISKVRILRSIK